MKETTIRSRLNPRLEVSVIAGHFATRHSHNNHYIDITRMKHEHTMAREAAMTLAQPMRRVWTPSSAWTGARCWVRFWPATWRRIPSLR